MTTETASKMQYKTPLNNEVTFQQTIMTSATNLAQGSAVSIYVRSLQTITSVATQHECATFCVILL